MIGAVIALDSEANALLDQMEVENISTFCGKPVYTGKAFQKDVLLCVCVFGVLGLAVFRFTSGGAVFAVGDEYQIAWSTSVKSAGSVTVNGVTYYDADNGRNRISTLHKVSVPMSELDRAKSYEINSVPGSLSYPLWADIFSPSQFGEILLRESLARFNEKSRIVTQYVSDVLKCGGIKKRRAFAAVRRTLHNLAVFDDLLRGVAQAVAFRTSFAGVSSGIPAYPWQSWSMPVEGCARPNNHFVNVFRSVYSGRRIFSYCHNRRIWKPLFVCVLCSLCSVVQWNKRVILPSVCVWRQIAL